MSKKHLPKLLALTVFTAGVFVAHGNFNVSNVFSAANHIVISQVQIRGSTLANDEFVELYNPTDSVVDLTNWKLKRKNSIGTEANLVASMSGSIASKHYFLVASSDYAGSVVKDLTYSNNSNNLTSNYAVLLYNNSDTTPLDKVGMGTNADFEASAAANPADGGSIQRKIDETGGHGLDTDHNDTDFELLEISDPRNSTTVVVTPSPTASPTASPTESPSPTPISTPTETPTPTPTESPTPSPTQTSSPSPSGTPAPSSTPIPMTFRNPLFTCTITYMNVGTGFIHFRFPKLSCTPNR